MTGTYEAIETDNQKILNLVIENEDRAGLGYTVVCNRSQSVLNIPTGERHAKEKSFFESAPWNEIPRERAGIGALKLGLNELSVDVTRRSFQSVGLEIESRLVETRKEFDHIGRPRSTLGEQRVYLLQTASNFQSLASKAVDAYYGRDDCFQTRDSIRLATTVMAAHETFSEIMNTHGSIRKFAEEAISDDCEGSTDEQDTPSSSGSTLDPCHSTAELDETPMLQQFPELKTVFARQEEPPLKETEPVMEWINKMYRRSKGFEIGTVNPSLLPSLFNEHSRSWRFHTVRHMQNVTLHIHNFIHELLNYVCGDQRVSSRIWAKLTPSLCQTYSKAMEHALFLIDVERNGNPITLNHYFADNLKKRRLDRLEKRLGELKTWVTQDGEKETLLRLKDTLDVYVSNEDHTVEDLHDTLKSYYKVARKRFVDAVCKQAIEYHLICAKDGPLWVFSPGLVRSYTDEELEYVAGEDMLTVNRRKKLAAEIESLIEGKKALDD
jgi:hypothetical protein